MSGFWHRTTLLLAVLVALISCAPDGENDDVAPGTGGAIDIEEPLPRHVQCMVDRGFEVTGRSGESGYEFESDLPQQDALRVIDECRELSPERPRLTDDQILEIYDDWVDQRLCLVGLGYAPEGPPSPEKFIEDWRSPSGPWMPIDGLQSWLWSDDEYEQAKAECGLEFYERS